jgi:hypothetical protein
MSCKYIYFFIIRAIIISLLFHVLFFFLCQQALLYVRCALVKILLPMTCIYMSAQVVKKNRCAKQREKVSIVTRIHQERERCITYCIVIDQHFHLESKERRKKTAEEKKKKNRKDQMTMHLSFYR